MKRIFSTIALMLFIGMGFAQDKAVKAEIYGFVRNYFTYDISSYLPTFRRAIVANSTCI